MCLPVPHFAIFLGNGGVSSPIWLVAIIRNVLFDGTLVALSVLAGTLKCSPCPQVVGLDAKFISPDGLLRSWLLHQEKPVGFLFMSHHLLPFYIRDFWSLLLSRS